MNSLQCARNARPKYYYFQESLYEREYQQIGNRITEEINIMPNQKTAKELRRYSLQGKQTNKNNNKHESN